MRNTIFSRIAATFIFITVFAGIAYSQDAMDFGKETCLECHDASVGESGQTVDVVLKSSIHQDFECIDCHASIGELPHEETLPSVDCGTCHGDEAATYQWHGRLRIPDGQDIPTCANCHGSHDILPSTEKTSSTNPQNLPKTCGHCHEDIDLTEKHEILYGHAVEVYQTSVHGKASLGGVYSAATCNDCHSTGGTAHRILAPNDTESTISHFNIPKTCGKCHRNIEADYWEGIHGKLVLRGEVDAPVCTHCHGEHGIISPSDPRSPVSASRLAEATCSPCHESASLNEKYGIPSRRLQTYVDSYHGLKSKAGDMTVANCSSCHGAHRILPHTDPTSSIHFDNLKETCGHCHPGISSEMAQTPIHGTPGITQTPVAGVVRHVYIIAIFIIIGTMVFHWLIDLRKEIQHVIRKPQVRRMNYNEVWQHNFLMVSFVVLVISGFALRFSNAFWVQWFFGWEGGFPLRGVIHRVAAVVLVGTTLWHLLYLIGKRGTQFLKDIFPVKRDFEDFLHMVGYNLGWKKDKPKFGRFNYVEKAEYWALVWGTAVMIITGFFLWFDNYIVAIFPKGVLDVMLVIHYYEAWLAMLAILVWHMYSTIFNPTVYPMNTAWINGNMPKSMYEHHHPVDTELSSLKGKAPANETVKKDEPDRN
ncbi:MAG: cytochrome b/b6 domain-containing protein [Candidatus Zixiibacteriota bacterium]